MEYILGIHIENGGEKVYFEPHSSGLKEIYAKLPLNNGWLEISMCGEDVKITAPEGTEIIESEEIRYV